MCLIEAKGTSLKGVWCFPISWNPETRGSKTGRLRTELHESPVDHGATSVTDEPRPSHFDWLSSGHMPLGNSKEER